MDMDLPAYVSIMLYVPGLLLFVLYILPFALLLVGKQGRRKYAIALTAFVIFEFSSITSVVALGSCSGEQETHRSVLLERNSPAVGTNGVLVENVGLEVIDGDFIPLLKTECGTPCKDSEIFTTLQDNQGEIEISLFRGTGSLVSENHPLGTCDIVNIPAAPRGYPQIEVTVEAADGEIRLSAVDMATKRPMVIQCGGVGAR
jgi:molecular chaperone DnaK (HSP70)